MHFPRSTAELLEKQSFDFSKLIGKATQTLNKDLPGKIWRSEYNPLSINNLHLHPAKTGLSLGAANLGLSAANDRFDAGRAANIEANLNAGGSLSQAAGTTNSLWNSVKGVATHPATLIAAPTLAGLAALDYVNRNKKKNREEPVIEDEDQNGEV